LVDDEEAILVTGKTILEKLGYEVITKTSALDALELFSEKPNEFDMVITDMTMPHMVGMELARRMLAIRPDTAIILCTGYNDAVSEEQVKAAGIREFLTKPLSVRELAKSVRNALGGQ